MSITCFKLINQFKHVIPKLIVNGYPQILSDNNLIYGQSNNLSIIYELTSKDEARRRQYAQIIGKVGIRKWDAGILWTHYKNKRIKIKKRRKVI